eukprot:640636-Prymnesium_polylepis.1
MYLTHLAPRHAIPVGDAPIRGPAWPRGEMGKVDNGETPTGRRCESKAPPAYDSSTQTSISGPYIKRSKLRHARLRTVLR